MSNPCGECDIQWYRDELSKTAVVLNQLRAHIAELEKDVDFWTGEAARIGEERNKAIAWLSSLGFDFYAQPVSIEIVNEDCTDGTV